MITPETLRNVVYFIREKGSPERMIGWESVKEDVFKEFPQLKMALAQREAAEEMLESVVDIMECHEVVRTQKATKHLMKHK